MRLLIVAAVAAFGLAACGETDTTVDEQTPATADHAAGAAANTAAATNAETPADEVAP